MVGWEATYSLSVVPLYFSLYFSGIFLSISLPNFLAVPLYFSMIAPPHALYKFFLNPFFISAVGLFSSHCGRIGIIDYPPHHQQKCSQQDSFILLLYSLKTDMGTTDHQLLYIIIVFNTGPSLTLSTSASSPSPPLALATSSRVFLTFVCLYFEILHGVETLKLIPVPRSDITTRMYLSSLLSICLS